MKYVVGFFLLSIFTLTLSNTIYANPYEAFADLDVSSSNMLLSAMESGFDSGDYDMFETCALRVLEIDLEESLDLFVEIFETTEPGANSFQPNEASDWMPYFYVSALALGQFGGDNEAIMLRNALMENDDYYVNLYVVKALGMMTNCDVALETLNQTAEWVASEALVIALLEAILAHNSLSSIRALNLLYYNSEFRDLREDVIYVSDYITSHGSVD